LVRCWAQVREILMHQRAVANGSRGSPQPAPTTHISARRQNTRPPHPGPSRRRPPSACLRVLQATGLGGPAGRARSESNKTKNKKDGKERDQAQEPALLRESVPLGASINGCSEESGSIKHTPEESASHLVCTMQAAPRITKSITVENLFRLISQMQREIAQDAANERGSASGKEVCLNAAEPGEVLLLDGLLSCIMDICHSYPELPAFFPDI